MSDILKRFELSSSMVKKLKTKPSDDELLQLYGLFKQSMNGDCDITEPSRIYFKEHAKWKAWYSLKNMTKQNAMINYSDLVMILIDKYKI